MSNYDRITSRAENFGTEQDKVTCIFYLKTGCCRHGESCTRIHDKPKTSRVILLPHLYIPPCDTTIDEEAWFEDFVEDILDQADIIGTVEELIVLQNTCEHMIGNVYIRFATNEQAQKCIDLWTNQYYRYITLQPELSPVLHFTDGRCKQHDAGDCDRGGICNFMHVRVFPDWLRLRLYDPDGFFRRVQQDTTLDPELYRDIIQKRKGGNNYGNVKGRYQSNNSSSSSSNNSQRYYSSLGNNNNTTNNNNNNNDNNNDNGQSMNEDQHNDNTSSTTIRIGRGFGHTQTHSSIHDIKQELSIKDEIIPISTLLPQFAPVDGDYDMDEKF